MSNMSDALGGFGAGPRVVVDGIEYRFIFDVPKMIAEMEQLCAQWRREQFAAKIDALGPLRHRPGTFEHEKASELWKQYEDDLDSGRLSPGGDLYQKWQASNDGKLAPLLAGLRVTRPDASMATITMLIRSEPDQIRAIMLEAGKAIGEFGARHLDSLRKMDPQKAAEAEARVATSMESYRRLAEQTS